METKNNSRFLKGYASTAIIAIAIIVTAFILAGAYKSKFNKQVTISVTALVLGLLQSRSPAKYIPVKSESPEKQKQVLLFGLFIFTFNQASNNL